MAEEPALRLARRLRELRERQWPGRVVTQKQLADALGASVPLISSWEHRSRPAVPPDRRLHAYATFFATERSVDAKRLLGTDELEPGELAARDRLLDDLIELRSEALGAARHSVARSTLWSFPPGQEITLVCALLPQEMRANMPFTNPADPDYIEYYSYGDLDSMLELYGHLRATCTENPVRIRHSQALSAEDISSNLVVLGGIQWNNVTDDVLRRLNMPIEQVATETDTGEVGFRVDGGAGPRIVSPVVEQRGDRRELIEDVALFHRGPNPYNRARTVTVFNGTFGRGTLGAVRSTIDPRFRSRNEDHIAGRLADTGTISLLMRVRMLNGKVITPDWTEPDTCPHEWPENSRDD